MRLNKLLLGSLLLGTALFTLSSCNEEKKAEASGPIFNEINYEDYLINTKMELMPYKNKVAEAEFNTTDEIYNRFRGYVGRDFTYLNYSYHEEASGDTYFEDAFKKIYIAKEEVSLDYKNQIGRITKYDLNQKDKLDPLGSLTTNKALGRYDLISEPIKGGYVKADLVSKRLTNTSFSSAAFDHEIYRDRVIDQDFLNQPFSDTKSFYKDNNVYTLVLEESGDVYQLIATENRLEYRTLLRCENKSSNPSECYKSFEFRLTYLDFSDLNLKTADVTGFKELA